MIIKQYNSLPTEAKALRTEVFVDEQGFREEFDTADSISTHFVGFTDGEPAATCRYFYDAENGFYLLGRVAVKKSMRGRHLGEEIIASAEKSVKERGADRLVVHAQLRSAGFYEKCGYIKQGEIFYEENYPHITMVKNLI